MYRDSEPTTGNDERYAGARALWIKVIVRAAFDWVSYRDSDRLLQRKLAENAQAWIFKPSRLFNGFENICLSLDLDPDRVRQWVSGLSKDQVAKIEHLERDHSYTVASLRLPKRVLTEPDEGF